MTIDAMQGKWIVASGKFEPGETAEECVICCVICEVKEETGLELTEAHLRA